jgi:prepilin-type N-terminal cleavage/methylation domain-containing protein
MNARRHIINRPGGFTLLEVLLASVIASIVLIAVYQMFGSAMKARNNAALRSRAIQMRQRATGAIRGDLQNALVSGGILASTLQGDSNGSDGDSSFPGYLKLTTTGGKDTSMTGSGAIASGTNPMYGDVQQVEYYIVRDTSGTAAPNSGDLVRMVTRDLLDTTPSGTFQQEIMQGVQSLQVSFYDGAQWQTSWQITGTSGTNAASGASTTSSSTSSSGTSGSGSSTTLPQAVRVDIQQAPAPGSTELPPPIEVLVPWTTTPYLSGTNFSVGSGTQ